MKENILVTECDHKSKGLSFMSWGACCKGCGEPYPFEAVETVQATKPENAPKHMIEAACKAINDRGKGNNVTIADVAFMIEAAISSPAPSVHHDDLAVDRFAAAMKAKLAQKRDEGRGGWEDKERCSNGFLSGLLVEYVQKGDPLDVGNLAMMIHQRSEKIYSS